MGIDGLAGHLLHQRAFVDEDAPALRKLAENGASARCKTPEDADCALAHDAPNHHPAYVWQSAPGWISVFTGVDPRKLGVASNDDVARYAEARTRYPSFPMLLQRQGLRVAAGAVSPTLSAPIVRLIPGISIGFKPGVLDFENGLDPDNPDRPNVDLNQSKTLNLTHRFSSDKVFDRQDDALSSWASKLLTTGDAEVVVVIFDLVDGAGHDHGFGDNHAYMEAITRVDARIAELIGIVESRVQKHGEQWLVIVTSDHGGGADGGHWQDPLHQRIPFIVTVMPHRNLAPLTQPTTHMDTFSTILAWFDTPHHPVDGKVQGIAPNRPSKPALPHRSVPRVQ
ncbi:alkaline phosphatase family protein [Myxococcota bacterium]|nr:alkaline phosphatase family protein [Myxococcota bacterium]